MFLIFIDCEKESFSKHIYSEKKIFGLFLHFQSNEPLFNSLDEFNQIE